MIVAEVVTLSRITSRVGAVAFFYKSVEYEGSW